MYCTLEKLLYLKREKILSVGKKDIFRLVRGSEGVEMSQSGVGHFGRLDRQYVGGLGHQPKSVIIGDVSDPALDAVSIHVRVAACN